MTQIKAVYFDVGNVLCRFDHMRACDRVAQWTKVTPDEIYDRYFTGEERQQRETGKQTDRGFFRRIKKQLAFPKHVTFEMFAEAWGDIFDPAPRKLGPLLRRLPKEVQPCIATNMEALHWPYIERLEGVRQLVHSTRTTLFRSYILGTRKPSYAFFEFALYVSKLRPEHVLFIDDTPDYVRYFREELGGHGRVFNLERDPISKLAHMLEMYELL